MGKPFPAQYSNHRISPAFVASLSSAWRAGEVRPTFSVEAKPRYLRSLQAVIQRDVAQTPSETVAALAIVTHPVAQIPPTEKVPERPQLIYAERGTPAFHAVKMVWPTGVPPPRRLSEYYFHTVVRGALHSVPGALSSVARKTPDVAC